MRNDPELDNAEQKFMFMTLAFGRQSLDIGIGVGLTRRRRERSLLLIVALGNVELKHNELSAGHFDIWTEACFEFFYDG